MHTSRISCKLLASISAIYIFSSMRLFGAESTSAVRPGSSIWDYFMKSTVVASPSLGNGVVYCGSWDNNFYAINIKTGDKVWEYKANARIHSSAAVGTNGLIYFGSFDHCVHAVRAKTGGRAWTFTTKGPVHSTPAIGPDGTVYIGSDDNHVYALDGATGSKKWAFNTGAWVESSPALTADGLVGCDSLSAV